MRGGTRRIPSYGVVLLLVMTAVGCGACSYSLGDLDLMEPRPDPFDSGALNFAVIGDWGRGGWFRQDDVAEQMGATCREIHCRFVISTGDNFYTDGVESLDDPKWQSSFENIYTAPSLDVPWYVTLGNHDYLGSVQAQIDYSSKSDRWTLPSRYYAVEKEVDDTTKALFVFIDTVSLVLDNEATSAFKGEAEWQAKKQLAWIDSTLAASDAQWKIVVGHHPVYSASAKHSDSPELRRELWPILERRGVEAYLCGHVHSLQHLKPEGHVNYFVSGGGSLARKVNPRKKALFKAGVSGFMAASITASRMTVYFIDYKGTIGYAADLPPRDMGRHSDEMVRHGDTARQATTAE